MNGGATARGDAQPQRHLLDHLNQRSAEQRVEYALNQLPGPAVLTSSFGIQSAVMLHLVNRVAPDIPVILIDTGYLFPETYRFVDRLTRRLDLDLRVYSAPLSPAWQEARFGQLWRQGLKGIERYNRINKVEPLARALDDLSARIWFSGLRRVQSSSRETLAVAERRQGRWKILPLVDWADRDVHNYLRRHQLPYHPLRERGYVSVGDVHTTRPLHEAGSEEQVRFFGLKRECGIHEQL